MSDKNARQDDDDLQATRMLVPGEEFDQRPPNPKQQSNADSLVPREQQETLVHSQGDTQQGSRVGASEKQPSEISNSVLNDSRSVVGITKDLPTGTQSINNNDATGEFVADFVASKPPVTERKTQRSTIRSGRGAGLPEVIPESVGKYEIKEVLGRGGMGVVYLARQAGLNRDVALKMVLSGAHASKAQIARFEAEARAVAQLQHPHIVQVFEVGEHDGLPYFSLEFVDGMSLDRRLDGKPLGPREAAQIVEKICRAMQYAHDRNILHRDLKPANILINENGDPKVTDFGLAKQLEDEDSVGTKAGTILGTPSYMSPEQAQGLVNELTPASDQYSLGALLYELLTGRPPFLGAKAFDTISQVVHKEPVPPCQLQEKLPADIDTICLKALQKTPDKRYADCQAMADDLGRFLRGEPILARPIGKVERAWRWCRRNPLIAGPSALAISLLIATAIVSTLSYMQISAQAAVITQERDKAQKEKEEADRQRILANEATVEAEESQKQAERQAMLALRNIQFIITEIDNQIAQQPGTTQLRLGLLDVLEKSWNGLDQELTGGIKGEAVPTLMAVRFKIAEAWVTLDQIDKADKQFEAIEKMARERLVVKNRSDASRVNLAQILVKRAPIRQRVTGDPAVGEKTVEEAESLLREVMADPRPEPGSPSPYEIANILQDSLLKRANAKMKSGELEKADQLFKEVEAVCQKVVDQIGAGEAWFKALPENQQPRIKSYFEQNVDLGKTGQANVLCRMGKAEQAIPIYEKVVQNRRDNCQASPTDPFARDQLALQLRNYGQYMLRVGRTEDAIRLLGQAHDATDENVKYDAENAAFKRSHGYSLYYWGVANAEGEKNENALALFERSRVLRQKMFETSPDKSNKVNLMLTEARLGNGPSALKLIDELSESKAKDADLRLDLARALAQLSNQEADVGKKDELRTRALAALEQAVAEGLQDPFAIRSEVDLKPLRDEQRYKELAN